MFWVVLDRDSGQTDPMIMIPLTFVIALLIGLLLVREVMTPSARGGWFIAFLGMLMFQELLVGTRFGYGMEWLRLIQPVTGAAIPPLAYLSFKRPKLEPRAAVHLWPILGVLLVIWITHPIVDGFLALNHLIYTGLLVRLGLRGSDGLTWVRLGHAQIVIGLLWLVVLVLLISGITDAVIAYDFMASMGRNTQLIAGWATLGGLLTVPFFLYFSWGRTWQAPRQLVEDGLFEQVGALMESETLYRDPEINLTRIARRLSRPARDVSRAINDATGGNVSQYVNGLRVEAACDMLKETDQTILAILYEAGFNTKSNFNREFVRVMGKTPSAWRGDQQKGTL